MEGEEDAEEAHGVRERFRRRGGGVGAAERGDGTGGEAQGARTFATAAAVNREGRPDGGGIHPREVGGEPGKMEDGHFKGDEGAEKGGRALAGGGDEGIEEVIEVVEPGGGFAVRGGEGADEMGGVARERGLAPGSAQGVAQVRRRHLP